MSVEIRVPMLAESIVEATVGAWLKKEGDRVSRDEVVTELATDKVSVEVYSPADGTIDRITHHEGDTVVPDDVLAILTESSEADVSKLAAKTVSTHVELPDASLPLATPVAERMAAERGLDLSILRGKGSGVNGKITIDDVKNIEERTEEAPLSVTSSSESNETATSAAASPLSELTSALGRREEREPLSRLRLALIKNLHESEQTAVRLTTFNEVDMSSIIELRTKRRDSFKERFGVGLGYMSFFTRAVVGALKAFPLLNAEIQGKDVVKKLYYDIGIAVGSDKGLLVPVVRDADRKTFAEIERTIAELAARAKVGKIKMEDLIGGTFTITNGGIYGSLMSTPILNGSQVGILGMHKIQERPVVVNGEVVARPMMYLALSYDHRLVDGSEAVRFLVRIKELLEDPETLLLEG